MEKDIMIFFQLLSQIHKNSQIQNTLRISIQSLKILFSQVDSRNKGYLDLADLYYITGDISQDQLFIVFKHLDRSRKGRIELQDFLSSMGKQNQINSNYNDDNFENSLKRVRQYFNILYQNANDLDNLKTAIGVTREVLFDIYRKISVLVKATPGKLHKNDLCRFLKNNLNFPQNLINQLNSLIISSIVKDQEFISSLMPMNYISINSIYINSMPYPRKQDYFSNDQYQVKQYQKKLVIKQNIQNQFRNNQKQPIFYPIQNKCKKIFQPRYLSSYKKKSQKSESYTKSIQKYSNKLYNNKQFKSIINEEDQYQKKLEQILKKRQELKRGSQERKKLIDEVMKRKRLTFYYETLQLDYLQNKKVDNNSINYLQRSNSNNTQTIKTTYIPQILTNPYKLSTQNQIKNERQSIYPNDIQYFKSSQIQKNNNHTTMNYLNSSVNINKFVRTAYSLQKQNIIKKVQEEAGKKIQQIERKVRMKMLQKKSTAGFEWIK